MLDAGLINPSPRLPGADPQIAQAVRRLRTALVRCEIEPGQFVAEQEIAERFGLGRAAGARGADRARSRRPRHAPSAPGLARGADHRESAARGRLPAGCGSNSRWPISDFRRLSVRGSISSSASSPRSAHRSDRQAVLTVRPADRQIRDALAARTDELTRRWLAELWDHRDRIVTALDHAGDRRSDRRPRAADRGARCGRRQGRGHGC